MVQTSFVCKSEDEIDFNLDEKFKSYNYNNLNVGELSEVKISKIRSGNFKYGDNQIKYFAGWIYFKAPIKDFEYSVDENLVDDVNDITNILSHKLFFLIFPDEKTIIFHNKKDGKRYGIKILSKILFNLEKRIKELEYKPTKILQAYKEGKFSDIWYNGVYNNGNITSVNQFGTDISTDPDFADKANRYGIGVELSTELLNGVKVAVYSSGILNCLTKNMDISDEIKCRYQVMKEFSTFI